jgi:hypothetical protein
MSAYGLETFYQSGKTVYAIIWNGALAWRNDTFVFEAFNASNWSAYAVPIAEIGVGGGNGTGHYYAAYPSQIDLTTIIPTEEIFQQIGGSPVQPTTSGGGDFLIGGGKSQGVNVSAIAGNLTATLNMSAAAGSEVRGVAATGVLSQTQMSTNLTATLSGAYAGRVVIWTSGVLTGVAAAIAAYDGSGKILTFSPVPAVPSIGDTFVIV